MYILPGGNVKKRSRTCDQDDSLKIGGLVKSRDKADRQAPVQREQASKVSKDLGMSFSKLWINLEVGFRGTRY